MYYMFCRHPTTFQQMTRGEIKWLYKELAPNFLDLIDLLLTIPATSAEAERGFSTLKLVKSKNRNRLNEQNLNTLLQVVLLSPPEKTFHPQPAIDHWDVSCLRRSSTGTWNNRARDQARGKATVCADSDSSDSDYVTLLQDFLKPGQAGPILLYSVYCFFINIFVICLFITF